MRNFENLLNDTRLNVTFKVITLPGATLIRIADTAIEILREDYRYQLIIVAGGINDMTVLRYQPFRHALPNYTSINQLVSHTTNEMRRCVERIQAYSDMPVALATLSGIDLPKYAPQYQYAVFRYQPIIDRAIIAINYQVRGVNRLNSLCSPDLSSAVHRCVGRRGRYRTHYTHLYDGLHPGYHLRTIWTRNIHNYCRRVFPDTHSHSGADGRWW